MYLVAIDGVPEAVFQTKDEAEAYAEDKHLREERGIAEERKLDMDDDYEKINVTRAYEGDSCKVVQFDNNKLPNEETVLLYTDDGDEVEVYVDDIRRLLKKKWSKKW